MADTTSSITEYIPILESMMRISLAGFGGAMAGLSISRRAAISRTTSTLLTNAAVKTPTKRKHAIHRHHPLLTKSKDKDDVSSYAVDRELPAAWAMACMAFTGVIEFTRFVSPAGLAVDLVAHLNDGSTEEVSTDGNDTGVTSGDNSSQEVDFSWLFEPKTKSTLKTIADYTIGGSIGGAIFAGSAVRTRAGRKIDASILGTAGRNARPLAGLLPGAGLGLLAGVTIVSIDLVREYLEENFGELDDQPDELMSKAGSEISSAENTDVVVPAHIKAMSNEELAKAIEDLRR